MIQITLKKPMGLVLADNKTRTSVIVEDVVPGGNADKSGKVQVGDIISRFASSACQKGCSRLRCPLRLQCWSRRVLHTPHLPEAWIDACTGVVPLS